MFSSNMSMAAAINNIKWSMIMFIQVWSITFFALGAVGQALNIYVFTRHRFRSNPCARYFLASTLCACVLVYIAIPLRLLQTVYNIDIFIYSLPVCQILSYLLNCFKVLISWFIALASVDRFCCSSSSVTLRAWSKIQIVSYVIPLTCLFIGIAYLHMPFNYTILSPQSSCTFASSIYQSFFSIWDLVFWSWIPSLCMLIFGLLTIRHVRQGRMRVASQNNSLQNNKKIDRQLIQMLIIQSFIFGSTTTAYSISNLYISITNNLFVKNDLQKAKEKYVECATSWLTITGPCLSFYLFTLSSKLFREELINLFCQRQVIQTHTNINGIITQRAD